MNRNEIRDPLDAIDEVEKLWPHNAHAVEDPALEEAVLYALSKPTDAPNGVALLRRAGKHGSVVRRLFDAVFGKALDWSLRDLLQAPCDRCSADVMPRHTLWVPAGATVVSVHCCDRCRVQLDDILVGLVWD